MFREFYLLMKQHRQRGWRLEGDLHSLYLSKFCRKYNNDEYRFYITIQADGFVFSHAELIKGYDQNNLFPVRAGHRYAKHANLILSLMNEHLWNPNLWNQHLQSVPVTIQ